MTDDEKRQQKAMLLLDLQEAKDSLEHLKLKAYKDEEMVVDLKSVLYEARNSDRPFSTQDSAKLRYKIETNKEKYKSASDPESVILLTVGISELRAKIKTLEDQKKALGMGS
jgi:hypothetical protein